MFYRHKRGDIFRFDEGSIKCFLHIWSVTSRIDAGFSSTFVGRETRYTQKILSGISKSDVINVKQCLSIIRRSHCSNLYLKFFKMKISQLLSIRKTAKKLDQGFFYFIRHTLTWLMVSGGICIKYFNHALLWTFIVWSPPFDDKAATSKWIFKSAGSIVDSVMLDVSDFTYRKKWHLKINNAMQMNLN